MVRYSLPRSCRVTLKYFDLRGRCIAALVNEVQGPGHHTQRLGADLASRGAYLMVFEAGTFVKREMTTLVGQ